MVDETIAMRIRMQDVPGIVDTEWISLTSGIVVLTGRNNVGKSRALTTIAALSKVVAGGGAQPTPEVSMVIGATTIEMRLSPEGAGLPSHYMVWTHPSAPPTSVGVVYHQNQWVQTSNGVVVSVLGSHPPTWRDLGGLPQRPILTDALGRLIYVPPHRPVPSTVTTTPVWEPSPDGSNLANVIYTHRSDDTEKFHELHAVMQDLFPEVLTLLARASGPNSVTLSYRDRFSGELVDLANAGTGVGQVLLLVASILLYPPGRIFLIDEPHAYLYPGVEQMLVAFMREHPEHYYVCATHSPVFLNAAEPEASWFVTRDEQGTRISSVFTEDISRRSILMDLGVRPGDVAFADRILFVEGPTEEKVFPILLDKVGVNIAAKNCSIVQLQGASATPKFSHAVGHLKDILQIAFVICLDGDMSAKYGGLPHVRFLPVNELEDLFLTDPAAIHEALLSDFDGSDMPPRTEVAQSWTVDDVAAYIAKRRENDPPTKASDILSSLAHEMGTAYSKTAHGPRIAHLLTADAAGPIVDTLRDFLGITPVQPPVPN